MRKSPLAFSPVLEVDSLPSLHERQRHVAVEVEMPEIAQEPHVLPVANTRQEGVQEHDALDRLRKLRRLVLVRAAQAVWSAR